MFVCVRFVDVGFVLFQRQCQFGVDIIRTRSYQDLLVNVDDKLTVWQLERCSSNLCVGRNL